jgi:hypothetical protein
MEMARQAIQSMVIPRRRRPWLMRGYMSVSLSLAISSVGVSHPTMM